MEVLQELESGKRIVEICRQNNISKATLYKWKKEYRLNPGNAFSGNGYKRVTKELHRRHFEVNHKRIY